MIGWRKGLNPFLREPIYVCVGRGVFWFLFSFPLAVEKLCNIVLLLLGVVPNPSCAVFASFLYFNYTTIIVEFQRKTLNSFTV